MRIDFTPQGLPRPIFELGDLVRLRRDDGGDIVTFRAGEWGEVVRVTEAALDIRLAGYARPRSTTMPMARDVPIYLVEPCDRRGTLVVLRQRDLDRTR